MDKTVQRVLGRKPAACGIFNAVFRRRRDANVILYSLQPIYLRPAHDHIAYVSNIAKTSMMKPRIYTLVK